MDNATLGVLLLIAILALGATAAFIVLLLEVLDDLFR